jgi:lipid II:glycine glycyltransferase (peptidoglycan interpeptide bridge formation enzyme)
VNGDGLRFNLLVLSRKIARFLSLSYVPFGPRADPANGRGEMLGRLTSALRTHLPAHTIFLRFDLPWEKTGEAPDASSARLKKARDDIQPSSTVIVDISGTEDAILAAMKPKTRYNIRLAAKRDVTVSEGSEDDLEAWYDLYRETGRRDRIAIHSKRYYAGLFRCAEEYRGAAPKVKLLLARAGGELLAGNIVAFWKTSAVYLYGASSGNKRNLMPTYALQWEAMRMAKAEGCVSYDLFGVPSFPDAGHPMYGLYQFKTGFSGTVLQRWGTWDVPLRPLGYAAYAAAERARLFFFRSVKKGILRVRGSKARDPAAAE